MGRHRANSGNGGSGGGPEPLPPTDQEGADEAPDTLVWQGVGHGTFVGLLAAGLCHWSWGLNLLILPFAYGYGMSRLRSWPELAAILGMLGTTVGYFCIYDIVVADWLDLWPSVALIVITIVLFLVFQFVVGTRVDAARVRALVQADSLPEDVERSQRWEEKYLARVRRDAAEDRTAWFSWWLARSFLALGAGLFVGLIWDSRSIVSLVFAIALFHFIVWRRASTYHRRLVQSGAELAVGQSTRRPVLFLRPFALDALPVAPMDSRWSLLKVATWFDKRTFEEFLADTFADVGPIIAIGRPGETVAALGAAREYADDNTWQDLVLHRARAAQLVIMEVDASPGMEWEIDHVSKAIGLRRLLILLPPGEDLFEPRSSTWYERWASLQSRHPFLPDVSENVAAVLFDDHDEPVIVGTRSSVGNTLHEVRAAWQRMRGQEDGAAWTREDATSRTAPEPPQERVPKAEQRNQRKERRRLLRTEAVLRGLADRRSIRHGRDDPEALRLRQELARILVAQGELRRALRLQEEVVTRRSVAEVVDGPLTLSALGDLGSTQRLMGDLTGFRDTAERVANGSERVFGEADPATFAARTQLGLALQELGELSSARTLLEAVLDSDAETVDREDRHRAQRLLGSVMIASGDFEGALALLTQTLETTREMLGDEHPTVFETMGLLAEAHAGVGERDLAAQHARDSLDRAERAFGPEHPLTVKYLVNAARHSADAADVEQARTLAERAVTITRKTLADDHPDALTAISVLGRARHAGGEHEPALDLFLLAWKGRRRILGDHHPHTLAALASVADVQHEIGRTDDALRSLEEAARGYVETLGPDHPHTQGVQASLERWRDEAEESES